MEVNESNEDILDDPVYTTFLDDNPSAKQQSAVQSPSLHWIPRDSCDLCLARGNAAPRGFP